MNDYDYIKVKSHEIKELDILQNDMWVLAFSDNRYLKVNTFTRKLIEKFNGCNKISDIISLLAVEGIDISEEEVRIFVDDFLIKNNVVEGQEEKKSFKLTFTFHIPIVDGENLNFLFDKFKFLFSKAYVIFFLIFCGITQLIALLNGDVDMYLQYRNNGGNLLSIVSLFLLGTIIHEIGHATAARYYGANVGKIGLGVYLFMPIAYTDLTSIWTLSKKERLVINCGGFYFSMIYSSILWVVGIVMGKSNLLILNIIILITMIMNLNPLLRMDGYWIVNDFFGIVNVNKRMLELLVYILKRSVGIKCESPFENGDKKNRVYYIYFICYLICNIVFLIAGVMSIIKIFA